MSTVVTVLMALFGMSMGSFVNLLIDRLPAGASILSPPSRCDSCGHRLSPGDLVPVFSFLMQRGRCRYCGARITLRALWVEVAAGVLFALGYVFYGLTVQFALVTFYGLLLLLVAVIDLEQRLILNKVIYPAVPAALALDLAVSQPSFTSGLAGAGAGLAVLLGIFLVSRGGLGMGDVKLAALVGAATGFPGVLVALLLGVVVGGVTAAFLVVLKIRDRKDVIPFGPFLALGTMATLVWGDRMLAWYRAMF